MYLDMYDAAMTFDDRAWRKTKGWDSINSRRPCVKGIHHPSMRGTKNKNA